MRQYSSGNSYTREYYKTHDYNFIIALLKISIQKIVLYGPRKKSNNRKFTLQFYAVPVK